MALAYFVGMKISLAQLNYHIGNFGGNAAKMKQAIEQAKADRCDLVVFSELSVCGYPPRDFLEFEDFIEECETVVSDLAKLSHDIAILVGAPVRNPLIEGKDLFNAAIFLHEGEVQHVAKKALLPTYDVFDEYRYFEPADEFDVIEYKGVRLAITVCEDIWNVGNENPMYRTCPMDHLITQKPDLAINLSASPFHWDQANVRTEVVQANVARYGIPMIYVNHVGAQTELIFDGGSLVVGAQGNVCRELPYFKEAQESVTLDHIKAESRDQSNDRNKNQLIHDAIILGLKDYFGKLGFTKAILGLSGGIDSALTAYFAAKALGPKNVKVLLMPSPYSSGHSVSDAEELVSNLGIDAELIRINELYEGFNQTLHPYFKDYDFDVTEENLQARIRGTLLMAFSNKEKYILLNTTNKSEMAVGYGTLYGDLCGGLSVIGDIYKTEVFEICRWINRAEEIIPSHIITKPPSAELRHDQKDSDSLPEYDLLDKVLVEYIENRRGPQEMIEMGIDEALVRRVLRLVNINEFKRYQTAPVLRVSRKAFGMGRRLPIVAKYLS